MSPRIIIAIVVSVIAGLLLGRVGPQSDLRHLREQVEQLQSDLAKKNRTGAAATLGGVKSMFKVSQADLDAGAKARRARAGEPGKTNAEAAVVAAASNVVVRADGANTQRWDRASISNEIEKVKKAWALRAEIARTNFIARTKLDEKQTQNFDTLVDAMNIRLGSSIDKWVATIKQNGQMSPELGLRMMTELGGDMVVTYDELDRKLPTDWRQNAGDKFEMVNFVDPEVLTPLQDLDGVVNAAGSGGGRHGGFRIGVGGP